MDFAARLDELACADLHVLGVAHGQVVVGADLGFAIGVGGAVFFGAEFAVAVGLDDVVALVADADLLVVFDVFFPVTLGMHVDLLGALAVFDAQLVLAIATRRAEGFDSAAGFVRWQIVRDDVFLVIQAAGGQVLPLFCEIRAFSEFLSIGRGTY